MVGGTEVGLGGPGGLLHPSTDTLADLADAFLVVDRCWPKEQESEAVYFVVGGSVVVGDDIGWGQVGRRVPVGRDKTVVQMKVVTRGAGRRTGRTGR